MNMKRTMPALTALVCAALMCAGCAAIVPRNEAKALGREIELDLGGAHVEYSYDSHGGFLGDGAYMARIDCRGTDVARQLETAAHWRELPLTPDLSLLAYGGERDGCTYGITTYGYDGRGLPDYENPFFPKIEHGMYYFRDRYSDMPESERYSDSQVKGRYSYNFTLAVYDSDTGMLYCYILDT